MYYTGNDLIDLQMKLQENKEEANPGPGNSSSYIARTAHVQHQEKEIEQFLKQGYTLEDVIYITRYGRAAVERKASELRWHNKQAADLRNFMFFGGTSPEGGHVAIFR